MGLGFIWVGLVKQSWKWSKPVLYGQNGYTYVYLVSVNSNRFKQYRVYYSPWIKLKTVIDRVLYGSWSCW